MTTSAFARERIRIIVRDLSRRYLPEGDLHTGETALAKIVAETEDPFKVLISTILSQRTRDEMTEIASRQLFSKYDTPAELADADAADVERLIKPVGFYRQKALQIVNVSQILLDRHDGTVPRTYEELIGHPRPPGQQPARPRADEDPRSDRAAPDADRAEGVLAPHQRIVHPVRERPLSTDRASLPTMRVHLVLPVLSADEMVS